MKKMEVRRGREKGEQKSSKRQIKWTWAAVDEGPFYDPSVGGDPMNGGLWYEVKALGGVWNGSV